jgi:predicted acyltransferase
MRITSAGAKSIVAPTTNNQAVDTLKPRREIGLDVWRGIAVALMILTHAVSFFHIGDDPTIVNIGIFGGMVSFVLFLFLSGASAYFSYVKYDREKHASKRF